MFSMQHSAILAWSTLGDRGIYGILKEDPQKVLDLFAFGP